MNGQWSMPWMAELEENKRAAALAAGEDPKTPSTGTPADTQPNTPIPGKHTAVSCCVCAHHRSLTCTIHNELHRAEKCDIDVCSLLSEDLSKSDEKEEGKKDCEDGKGTKKMDDSEVIGAFLLL